MGWIDRDVQPHRIQPKNPFPERNLFLESLLSNKPQSTERSSSLNHPPLLSTQTGDSSTELLRSKHAQGLYPYPFAEPSTYRTVDDQQPGKKNSTTVITGTQILLTEQFEEWSNQRAKGYTTSNYQTWVYERARDKRLLAKWGKGLSAKKQSGDVKASKAKSTSQPRMAYYCTNLDRNNRSSTTAHILGP
jgi:hypothetical protein